jgi:hypothetical protein
MVQCGERLGFALEARDALGIGSNLRRQDLQRDVAIELGVARPLDVTHSARPDSCGDLVRSEPGAGVHGFRLQLLTID